MINILSGMLCCSSVLSFFSWCDIFGLLLNLFFHCIGDDRFIRIALLVLGKRELEAWVYHRARNPWLVCRGTLLHSPAKQLSITPIDQLLSGRQGPTDPAHQLLIQTLPKRSLINGHGPIWAQDRYHRSPSSISPVSDTHLKLLF